MCYVLALVMHVEGGPLHYQTAVSAERFNALDFPLFTGTNFVIIGGSLTSMPKIILTACFQEYTCKISCF